MRHLHMETQRANILSARRACELISFVPHVHLRVPHVAVCRSMLVPLSTRFSVNGIVIDSSDKHLTHAYFSFFRVNVLWSGEGTGLFDQHQWPCTSSDFRHFQTGLIYFFRLNSHSPIRFWLLTSRFFICLIWRLTAYATSQHTHTHVQRHTYRWMLVLPF